MKIRNVTEKDTPQILAFIKELAEYEKMSDEVVATEDLLNNWLFEKKIAEVIFIEENGIPFGFALYFHNFSTFVGRGGIYLEDLYIKPEYRGKGYGKQLFTHLAKTAVERGCGRFEWCCLDWNKPSINFYTSMGAKPMKDWTTYRLDGQPLKKLAGL